MREKGGYTLYILLCADDSYYTGITRTLRRRLAQHDNGEVTYTTIRLPVRLVYEEKFKTETEAVAREKQLKGWGRRKKEALIRQAATELPGLAKKIWKKKSIA